jgi:hypothetical protein
MAGLLALSSHLSQISKKQDVDSMKKEAVIEVDIATSCISSISHALFVSHYSIRCTTNILSIENSVKNVRRNKTEPNQTEEANRLRTTEKPATLVLGTLAISVIVRGILSQALDLDLARAQGETATGTSTAIGIRKTQKRIRTSPHARPARSAER